MRSSLLVLLFLFSPPMDWAPMWSRRLRTNRCGSLRCITPRSARERVLFFLLFLVMIDGLSLALKQLRFAAVFKDWTLWTALLSLPLMRAPSRFSSFSLTFDLTPSICQSGVSPITSNLFHLLVLLGFPKAGFPLKHDRATPLFSTYPFPCYLC